VKVRIKLLNVYSKYLPSDAHESAYDLDAAAGVRIEELLARVPVPVESQVILINGRTPLDGQALKDGDVVTIFPAMAGG
jgi:molybdopterin converting factor small subunit